jgi:hypothetical protein
LDNNLLYTIPYNHQTQAIEKAILQKKDLIYKKLSDNTEIDFLKNVSKFNLNLIEKNCVKH